MMSNMECADMKLAAHEIDTCAEAIRALATPAPEEKAMTDQGALERAREIYAAWKAVPIESEDYTSEGLVKMVAAALTAAASEARAAAIEECIGTLDGYKQDIIDNENWPDQDAELLNTLDSAIHMLRALATPAQCDHHWIGGNDGVWCTKCKEERSNAPAQAEGK